MVLAKLKPRSLLLRRQADCTKYGYDASGNRNSVTDNQGTAVSCNYDLRRLVTVREWTVNGQPVARSEFGYNARSERTNTQHFDGAIQVSRSNSALDDAGRLTEIIA